MYPDIDHLLGKLDREADGSPAREAAVVIRDLCQALRDAARTDKSRYDHHEPRPFDGRRPELDGGTIWRTPREIARRALGEPDLATFAELRPARGRPAGQES